MNRMRPSLHEVATKILLDNFSISKHLRNEFPEKIPLSISNVNMYVNFLGVARQVLLLPSHTTYSGLHIPIQVFFQVVM